MNIRGFGKDDKSENKINWFRRIRTSECPNLVAIQETKCEELTDNWIEFVWGSSDFGYIQKPKIGKFGDETIIVNIYGPHNDEGKIKFWDSLEKLMVYPNAQWVICGDFNEVRFDHERKNCEFISRRAARFNTFIDESALIDVPLFGKRFTRICDNGRKMSKLDRFLISDNLSQTWGELSLTALDRNTSDHCPLILRDTNTDFGPKPFRVFDIWLEQESAEQIITQTWAILVTGFKPDVCFCKKLKNIKEALRKWSKSQYGQIDIDVDNAKQKAAQIE
ncbi:uncharacterized protein [Rutidosis leptorrhynchoides]|uniref:uncharacterized protein n=1 Tax=Rutidosis leptorrhynchoides TaxID=125765 RepID=UPI003A98E943